MGVIVYRGLLQCGSLEFIYDQIPLSLHPYLSSTKKIQVRDGSVAYISIREKFLMLGDFKYQC